MKSKVLISYGNIAGVEFRRGGELVGDSEQHRRLIINGGVEPLDDEAKAVAASERMKVRFFNEAYAKALKADVKACQAREAGGLGHLLAITGAGLAAALGLGEPLVLAALPFLALPVLLPLTDVGRNWIATAIMNSGPPTFFDNSNARLGVGDSNTAFAKGQSDLQAGANKLYDPMEATYPSLATNVLTFRSLFGTGEANWAWEEWGVFNGSPGTMLSRKVETLGTKTSAQSWQLTADVTVNNP